jgi:hypothetical protein
MAGVFDSAARGAALTMVAIGLWVTAPRESEAQPLTPVKRAEMIDVARKMAEFRWVPSARNLVAACVSNYRTPWRSGEAVTGVAYDWGGMDSLEVFRKRLASGEAAGSHKTEGSTRCTAGVDCSGLVSLAWRLPRKFSTSDIPTVSAPLNLNIFTELKAGDVLNKAGSHVVIFSSYNRDGSINVYEAVGQQSRVVLTRTRWSRLQGYVPLRYRATVD